MNLSLRSSLLLLVTGAAVAAKDFPAKTPGEIPGTDLAGLHTAFLKRHLGKTSETADSLGPQQAAALSTSQIEKAYLKASNPGRSDYFGTVAISGDTAVVGAPFEDSIATTIGGDQESNKATNSGAAYIFVKTAGKWTQQAYLKSSDSKAGDEFGFSVAISGNSVVIGAFAKSTSTVTGTGATAVTKTNPYQGAAYVFTRSGTTWSQEATLLAAKPDGYDAFGYSVAISGNTVVVGAIGESSAAKLVDGNQTSNTLPQSGAAYVFSRSGTAWTQQAYLKASKPGKLNHFGMAVAISGELVAVGAPDRAASGGAAYTYARTGVKWKIGKILPRRNANLGDRFGRALALSGSSLLVGAPGEASNAKTVGGNPKNNKAPRAGAAYLYSQIPSGWSLPVYLKSSKNSQEDAFGSAVAVVDGFAVVGAPGEDSGGKNTGAAYLFTQNDAVWSETRVLLASDRDPSDRLGSSVALDNRTAICGAEGESSDATGVDGDKFNKMAINAGAAYIFEQLGAEISVETGGALLVSRESNVTLGKATLPGATTLEFTLRNLKTTPLSNLTFTVTGTNSAGFTVDSTMTSASIPPGGTTTFKVTFTAFGDFTGLRTATITCASKDSTVDPFVINLDATITN